MAGYIYDRQTEKEYMDASFYFRLDTFKHLYYCPSCTRSFDTKEKTDKCVFCNGNIPTQKSMLNDKENKELKELIFDRPSKLLSDTKLSDLIRSISIKNIATSIKNEIMKLQSSSKRS